MSTLERAIAIAARVHEGQFDKAGEPYILHPLRIMMRMPDETSRIVAVLHDVLEDSPPADKWTAERLQAEGFAIDVVDAVLSVSRLDPEGETYEAFIERAATNKVGRVVKIADLEDNMNLLRMKNVRPKDLERLDRYHKAWAYLTESKS